MKRRDHEIWVVARSTDPDQPSATYAMDVVNIEYYQHPNLGAIQYGHVDGLWKRHVCGWDKIAEGERYDFDRLDQRFREACAKLVGETFDEKMRSLGADIASGKVDPFNQPIPDHSWPEEPLMTMDPEKTPMGGEPLTPEQEVARQLNRIDERLERLEQEAGIGTFGVDLPNSESAKYGVFGPPKDTPRVPTSVDAKYFETWWSQQGLEDATNRGLMHYERARSAFLAGCRSARMEKPGA